MTGPLDRLAKHPSLWWVWGASATVPFTAIMSTLCVVLAIVLWMRGMPAQHRLETLSGIALFPLLIAGLGLSAPGIMRIASMYRAEALQVTPGLNKTLLKALCQIVAFALTPCLLLSLALQSLLPTLIGMAFLGVFLLSYWHFHMHRLENERAHLLNAVATAAPTLMFISLQQLVQLKPDWISISAACALFFPVLIWRIRQLTKPNRTAVKTKASLRMPLWLARFEILKLLLSAATMVALVLLYSRITKTGSIMLFTVLFAYAIPDANTLRDRLQQRWLNGCSRRNLISAALKDVLQKQCIQVLLTAIALLGVAAIGLLPWHWLWPLLISLALGATPILTWQLSIVARTRRDEAMTYENQWRVNFLRATPIWVIFPWLIATMIFFDLHQDDLVTFTLYCAVLAIGMTAVGVPVLRRAFRRIEL